MGAAHPTRGEENMISPSEAAAVLGRIKSPKRAAAARENGKKGGRPPRCELLFDVRRPGDGADVASAPAGASIRVPRRVAVRLAQALVAGQASDQAVLDEYLPRIRAAAEKAGGEFAGFG